jgi:hypothetical protein
VMPFDTVKTEVKGPLKDRFHPTFHTEKSFR